MRRSLMWTCLIAGCAAAACSNSSVSDSTHALPPARIASAGSTELRTDQQAITDAIERHLHENKGINMSVMEMTVRNVSISGDQAQADTEFRLEQGGTSMLITYYLQRHADGWLVVRNQPSNSGQFAHPPMDKVHSGATAAPAMPDLTNFLHSEPARKGNAPPSQQQP